MCISIYIKCKENMWLVKEYFHFSYFFYLVDPCPKIPSNRVKIRYPGDCRRFIDCQYRYKII